jgi:uncharacterized protein
MIDFLRDLEYIRGTSLDGGPFYYFPDSMTLIEFDDNFGRLLEEIRRLEDPSLIERLDGYPEGYVQDVLFNIGVLREKGLLNKIDFPGIPAHVPLGQIIVGNTMRCNLACTYCYNRFEMNAAASQGGIGLKSNGAPSAEGDMTVDTFHLVTRFLEESGEDLPRYDLFFIGGEPLLNPEILEEAARWRKKLQAKGKDVLLAATTNAVLLDGRMADFCREHGIRLKITLDGTKEEHDSCRVFPGGGGTHRKIVDNLPGFFSTCQGTDRYAATTIDTRKAEPRERADLLSALGFEVIDLTELYSPGGDEIPDERELEEDFRRKYADLLDFLLHRIRKREYLRIIPVHEILKGLHTRKPAFMRCRAGGDSLAVSPDGTVYACHHFFGDARYALGRAGGGATSAPALDELEEGTTAAPAPDSRRGGPIHVSALAPYRVPVTERPVCSTCWARLLCGGPCFHRSLAMAGDPFAPAKPECIRRKALIIETLRFYIKLSREDCAALEWLFARG